MITPEQLKNSKVIQALFEIDPELTLTDRMAHYNLGAVQSFMEDCGVERISAIHNEADLKDVLFKYGSIPPDDLYERVVKTLEFGDNGAPGFHIFEVEHSIKDALTVVRDQLAYLTTKDGMLPDSSSLVISRERGVGRLELTCKEDGVIEEMSGFTEDPLLPVIDNDPVCITDQGVWVDVDSNEKAMIAGYLSRTAVSHFYQQAQHETGTPENGLRFLMLLSPTEQDGRKKISTPCLLAAYPNAGVENALISPRGHVTGYRNEDCYTTFEASIDALKEATGLIIEPNHMGSPLEPEPDNEPDDEPGM